MDALMQRYHDARRCADTRDCQDVLEAFEAAVQESCCVVNVDLDFLFHFFGENGNALYSTYQLGVRGQMRKHAAPDHDRDRTATEAILFGSYGDTIRYGALSPDGAGLRSYGPYAMRLRDVAIAARASVLEENSYDFVERHRLTPRSSVPRGYRAVWENRSLLAIAKLGSRLRNDMLMDEFAGILLFSNGDRSADEFLEVHIYGSFDSNAVEAVRGSSTPALPGDEVLLARVKDVLARIGGDWIEDA